MENVRRLKVHENVSKWVHNIPQHLNMKDYPQCGYRDWSHLTKNKILGLF